MIVKHAHALTTSWQNTYRRAHKSVRQIHTVATVIAVIVLGSGGGSGEEFKSLHCRWSCVCCYFAATLVLPQTNKRIRRAVIESGPCIGPWGPGRCQQVWVPLIDTASSPDNILTDVEACAVVDSGGR